MNSVTNGRGRSVSLTGIKPTGEPHLGNLVGAIRPALNLASDYNALYFVADYHALTTIRSPSQLQHFSRSIAAAWIAAGLDPQRMTIYRQSDIPEVFELSWILSCVTAKGLMNRAHAYKAARDRNAAAGVSELDAGVNMGLFNYPVLMAADILLMSADVVPVGYDQLQHVEYAADIAGSYNHIYGEHYSLKKPQPRLPDTGTSRILPGIDGRKMSKSYSNTIPMFCEPSQLRKLVRKIATDSTPQNAPKNPDTSHAFQILSEFAPMEVVCETRARLADGMSWGELKDVLYDVLDQVLRPMRVRYHELMLEGAELDILLMTGAERARERASLVLDGVRGAVGI